MRTFLAEVFSFHTVKMSEIIHKNSGVKLHERTCYQIAYKPLHDHLHRDLESWDFMKVKLDGILIFPLLALFLMKIIIKCKHQSIISFSKGNTLILVPGIASKHHFHSTTLYLS